MEIVRRIQVPTGDILVVQGEKGKLELLSLGDYGKDQNVKADFLGISRDIDGVPHVKLLPLEVKWVITISDQYGCSMGCKFCDVPKVGPGKNATFHDLVDQVHCGMAIHPEVEHTKRLNLHFARMGEPTYNWDVINAATYLAGEMRERGWGFHPVVSTMMPRFGQVREYLDAWMHLKNVIQRGDAGLQLSINSTDNNQRDEMFNGNAMSLEEIAWTVDHFKVIGRKITLNFALADNYIIDADRLKSLFDPSRILCKITPMHRTEACAENNLKTSDGYTSYIPYKNIEERLKRAGFDVIVFIPSYEEDAGRITCGNAILSGSVPACEYKDI